MHVLDSARSMFLSAIRTFVDFSVRAPPHQSTPLAKLMQTPKSPLGLSTLLTGRESAVSVFMLVGGSLGVAPSFFVSKNAIILEHGCSPLFTNDRPLRFVSRDWFLESSCAISKSTWRIRVLNFSVPVFSYGVGLSLIRTKSLFLWGHHDRSDIS